MKDENGDFIPAGTPIINNDAVHDLAPEYLDISRTNPDETSKYAELMDMTWSDEANGWVDWNEISKPKYYCSKCKKQIKDSFSSQCCGAYSTDRKNMIANVIV